jgi:ubiquinone/menaquinone biosynthesis C-methylase UbiE
MHEEAKNLLLYAKNNFENYFKNIKVLDVGSGDINGNNRYLFTDCEYEGNDVIEGKNVTIVSRTKDLKFEDNFFDTIISSECFEHDPEYKQSLKKIYAMLKPNGLFVFTCASTNRYEHGTRRTTKTDSLRTIGEIEDMQDYYKNLTKHDINEVLNLNENFSYHEMYYNKQFCDLYFVGIKKINNYEETNTITIIK